MLTPAEESLPQRSPAEPTPHRWSA